MNAEWIFFATTHGKPYAIVLEDLLKAMLRSVVYKDPDMTKF